MLNRTYLTNDNFDEETIETKNKFGNGISAEGQTRTQTKQTVFSDKETSGKGQLLENTNLKKDNSGKDNSEQDKSEEGQS